MVSAIRSHTWAPMSHVPSLKSKGPRQNRPRQTDRSAFCVSRQELTDAENFLQTWNNISKDAGKHVDETPTLNKDEVDKLTELILRAKTTRLEVKIVLVAKGTLIPAKKKAKFTKYLNEFASRQGAAAKIAPALSRIIAGTK